MLQNARLDGVVIWGEVPEAALILKQMRATGMKQPVFGASRLCYPQLIESAGAAAEGLLTTAALDPERTEAKWIEFQEAYRKKFSAEPDAYAAYAYDGMNLLIAAVDKAGLNRGRIMDALREHQGHEYEGVAGRARFDYTLNNVEPPVLARVEGGKFVYSPVKAQSASAGDKEPAGER
jgi:branched-chain amino acid transport system substrate-binding protein